MMVLYLLPKVLLRLTAPSHTSGELFNTVPTWYHSHIGLQAWEGLFGGIVINGPASANYDEDKGVIIMNDWDYNTVDQLFMTAQKDGPPTLDTALINGTNVFGTDGTVNQSGTRFNTSFTAETSYRLRLVNAACDTHFKFSIDNHTMTVIANDLVPIQPYKTNVLNIAMGEPDVCFTQIFYAKDDLGQRYDVIVKADQVSVAKNFWLRAIPQNACSENANPTNVKGIIYYSDSPSTPSTTGYSYTDSCVDEDMSELTPIVSEIVSSPFCNKSEPVSLGKNGGSLYRWKLNSTSMHVDWTDPTLLEVYRGHNSWTNASGVVELPHKNVWTYVVIETSMSVPHPIHLRGHDIVVLAQGSRTYTGDVTTLASPPKRDTAMLPDNGYLVIAFKTDNPGA
jgi:FtsP/CotA-like multicopper oxidase with cupredoxin domain